jgi:hypothetical protein
VIPRNDDSWERNAVKIPGMKIAMVRARAHFIALSLVIGSTVLGKTR